MLFRIVPAGGLALEAPERLVGNTDLSLRQGKRILYDPEAGVYNEDPSIEDIGQHGKLRIRSRRIHAGIAEISVPGHFIAQDLALVLHVDDPPLHLHLPGRLGYEPALDQQGDHTARHDEQQHGDLYAWRMLMIKFPDPASDPLHIPLPSFLWLSPPDFPVRCGRKCSGKAERP